MVRGERKQAINERVLRRASVKTYGPGNPITIMAQFDFALREGTLLYHKGWNKTVMPVVLANMQYRVVKMFVERGQLSFARKI